MIRCKYYLDFRGVKENNPAPLKLAIHKRGAGAFLPTEIRLNPDQWDAKAQKVLKHPHKDNLNTFLASFRLKVESSIRDMVLSGEAAPMTATQIKNHISAGMFGTTECKTLLEVWTEVSSGKEKHTAETFHSVWASIVNYDRHASTKDVKSIDTRWMNGYVCSMDGLSSGTRKLYLSKLNNVLNHCLKKSYISVKPSVVEKIPSAGIRRRNLSAAMIHTFMTAPFANAQEEFCIDVFKFSFFCRAANPADLFHFTPANIVNGRIEYKRRKTGRWYSVKVEPELQSLIDKLTDGKHLCALRYKNPIQNINPILSARAKRLGLPHITLYWARHTFASLAFELGNSMDMVSAALGHSLGGAKITSTYVAVQDYKVDALSRAVYDAALNGQIPK